MALQGLLSLKSPITVEPLLQDVTDRPLGSGWQWLNHGWMLNRQGYMYALEEPGGPWRLTFAFWVAGKYGTKLMLGTLNFKGLKVMSSQLLLTTCVCIA